MSYIFTTPEFHETYKAHCSAKIINLEELLNLREVTVLVAGRKAWEIILMVLYSELDIQITHGYSSCRSLVLLRCTSDLYSVLRGLRWLKIKEQTDG